MDRQSTHLLLFAYTIKNIELFSRYDKNKFYVNLKTVISELCFAVLANIRYGNENVSVRFRSESAKPKFTYRMDL